MLSWKPHEVKESAAVCDALFVFLTNKLIPYLIPSILSTSQSPTLATTAVILAKMIGSQSPMLEEEHDIPVESPKSY